MNKKHKIAILAMFIVLFAFPSVALAFSAEHGNSVYIAKDKTIDGNLYAAGANVTIDGHVTGDIFCAGQAVSINGNVDGDVICAGQSIAVSGNIGGNIRAAGSNIEIRGKVARGISVAGANVELAKDASVGWDALIASANANLSGNIGRALLGAGANFVLGGSIGKDTILFAGNNRRNNGSTLTVLDSAVLGGDLAYTSDKDASISPKAQIKGKVSRNLPPARGGETSRQSGAFGIFLFATLSALVVGYVLAGIWKQPVISMTDSMLDRFWPTLGWGVVWTIVAPVMAILLAITVIGIRLTLMTFWSWLILLMLSKVVVGIAAGRWLLKEVWEEKKDSMGWAVAIGIILSWIVFYIPIIGWFVSLIAMWWGAGAILIYLKKNYDHGKAMPGAM